MIQPQAEGGRGACSLEICVIAPTLVILRMHTHIHIYTLCLRVAKFRSRQHPLTVGCYIAKACAIVIHGIISHTMSAHLTHQQEHHTGALQNSDMHAHHAHSPAHHAVMPLPLPTPMHLLLPLPMLPTAQACNVVPRWCPFMCRCPRPNVGAMTVVLSSTNNDYGQYHCHWQQHEHGDLSVYD